MDDDFDDCILDDFLDEDDRDDDALGVATPRRAKGRQGGQAMTSSDSSPHQLLAGLTFFLGTALAVLASTLGSDPLTGIIVLGGSSLVAWSIAAQGELWGFR